MPPIRIGYSLSLTGRLAANGQTARLAHQLWQEDVNARGGLLGRPVELRCVDDQSDAGRVADLYRKLLDEDGVDLLLGGYGNNSISPAMPVVTEHRKFFVGLMGLAVNSAIAYDRYFAMIPTGPDANAALTTGFFEAAAQLPSKPRTVAILAADADFAKNPIAGARANARRVGLEVASEEHYSLSTPDYGPVVERVMSGRPDVLFLCSYLNDSVGLLRALASSSADPQLVGGAMIGPQSSAVQGQLGPALNGVVNYEYWLPTPALDFPGVRGFIARYQERARGTPADALGYYVAPMAYAQLEVLAQAITGTGSVEDGALAEYARGTAFRTVVGEVRFGRGGEWAAPRVLTVQFRGIASGASAEFAKPGSRVVLAPGDYVSGSVAAPYRAASRAGP